MKDGCIVLVPYHKNDLTILEKYSLDRVLKILATHPVSFFSPEGLVISDVYKHIPVQRFEKKHFQALRNYNQLLLFYFFYKRFLSYKYLLIYQLDCLVFKDELIYWCSLDYDYYGAPWNKTWKKKYYNFFG